MTICAILTLEFLLTSYISSTAAIRMQLWKNTLCLTWRIKQWFVMFSWFHRQLLKSLSAVIDVDSTPDRHKLEELKLSLHQLCHCFLSICSLKQGNGLTDHLLHFAVMSKWCFCSVFLLFHSVKLHWCYCLVLWIHAIGVGLFSTSSQNREQIIHSRL